MNARSTRFTLTIVVLCTGCTESQGLEQALDPCLEAPFSDVTEASGIDWVSDNWSGIGLVDVNGDGHLDVLAGGRGDGLGLFLGRGDLTFEDHRLLAFPRVTGFAATDIDGDGQAEVALFGEGVEAWLVATETGYELRPIGDDQRPRVWIAAGAFGDAEGDGLPDLYTAAYFDGETFSGATNNLWQGGTDTDEPWLNRAVELGGALETANTLAVSWCDLDSDGRSEVMAFADFGPATDVPNAVLQLDDTGHFQEVASLYGLDHEIFSMGIAVFDANLDGQLDIYVTNIGANVLAMATEDGFRDQAREVGAAVMLSCTEGEQDFTDWPQYDHLAEDPREARHAHFLDEYADLTATCPLATSWSALAFDYDQDGAEDLFVTNGPAGTPHLPEAEIQRDVLLHNNGDGTFEDVSSCSGVDYPGDGRGAAMGDLDGDGDLDLVVANTTLGSPVGGLRVYRNNAEGGHYLEVTLRGIEATPDGLGARVIVHTGSRSQIREVTTSVGFASTRPATVHFGLGDAEAVDRVEVIWPSGRLQTLGPLSADTHLVVEEAP